MPASPSARPQRQEGGKLRGIGMTCYIEACGIAPSAAVGSLGAGVGLWESAEVRVNAVGTIEVLTGSHSHGQGHETTFAQLVNAALRRADRFRLDRPRRHRQGADGHGHLRLALGRGRHVGHRQGARQGRGQGQEDRRASAGSRRGRHRHRERRAEGRRHRQERAVVPDGACRLHRAQSAGRHGAGPEGDGLLRSVQLHLPGRLLHLRGRDRSGNRHDRDRPVRRRRRFRQHHQSDDRRGPGAWRHRAGHRPGVAGRRALRCRAASC